jgi:hypothetical protein
MKNIAAIAIFVASTFITAGSARAQRTQVNATVPFNFTVGEQSLPAGNYTIGSALTSPEVLTIRNWDKKINMLSHGEPTLDNSEYGNTLVFHKYGDRYFLSDIYSAGASLNIHFPTTKEEKQAKLQAKEARLSVNDPILIALK